MTGDGVWQAELSCVSVLFVDRAASPSFEWVDSFVAPLKI